MSPHEPLAVQFKLLVSKWEGKFAVTVYIGDVNMSLSLDWITF